jgi:hypothetical protein
MAEKHAKIQAAMLPRALFGHGKISKKFRECFFQIFFGYRGSKSNMEYACEIFWGLRPLVDEVLTV